MLTLFPDAITIDRQMAVRKGLAMGRRMTKEEWLRLRRLKYRVMVMTALTLMAVILVVSILLIRKLVMKYKTDPVNTEETIEVELPGEKSVQINYLTPNRYSRSQEPLIEVKGIVIHYTANPGTSAKANRNYFEGLAKTKSASASSHYVIGIDGEVIQCIPLTEIAYASNSRNIDTVSIECCHEDETGKFNEKTYASLVSLAASLCRKYHLGQEDILRHYDVSEKQCPLYYVENEEAWIRLQKDIMKAAK